jgi:hypothetical protein
MSAREDLIKVGYCVAYDWYMLQDSIPLIYDHADVICLSLDVNRTSWSGNKFELERADLDKLIRSIDRDNKISVSEESFYLPELSPMQNEVRQRNRIAELMGKGGWHIQLDCDEYFLDFKGFTDFLKRMSPGQRRKINVSCPWIILYKQMADGFLYVDPEESDKLEYMQIATYEPHYEHSRRNGNFNILTNFQILHQSWARTDDEVQTKLRNWGHSQDLDPQRYFETWQQISKENFQRYHNLHPLVPTHWPSLAYVKGKDIAEISRNLEIGKFPMLSAWELVLKNSKLMSRLRKILRVTGA